VDEIGGHGEWNIVALFYGKARMIFSAIFARRNGEIRMAKIEGCGRLFKVSDSSFFEDHLGN
jgi:hypothetical protein